MGSKGEHMNVVSVAESTTVLRNLKILHQRGWDDDMAIVTTQQAEVHVHLGGVVLILPDDLAVWYETATAVGYITKRLQELGLWRAAIASACYARQAQGMGKGLECLLAGPLSLLELLEAAVAVTGS